MLYILKFTHYSWEDPEAMAFGIEHSTGCPGNYVMSTGYPGNHAMRTGCPGDGQRLPYHI